MRATLTLTLLVCLASVGFAGEAGAEWNAAHQAGVNLLKAAAWGEAASAFEKSWPLAQTPRARAVTATDLAVALHAQGREQEARPWFERAIGIWQSMPGESDEIAQAAVGLSDVDRGLGDFVAAEQALRRALDTTTPSVEFEAELRNRLAEMMREQGRTDESRRHLTAALALPGTSSRSKIDSLIALAELDRQTMRFNESIDGENKALSMARGEGSVKFEALALRGLGLTYLNSGQLTRAEPLLRRSIALFEKDPQVSPQRMADALACIAALYFEQKKYTLAEEALVRSLAFVRQAVGEEHPQSAVIMETLAEVYIKEDRLGEAEKLAEHARSIMQRNFGERSLPAAEAIETAAWVEHRKNDLARAAADYALALGIMRSVSQAPSDQRIVAVMNRYSTVLAALHRKREVKELQMEMKAFRAR